MKKSVQRIMTFAVAGLVGIAGLTPTQRTPSLVSTAQAAGEGPGIPERNPTKQNVRVFGRDYCATFNLTVFIGGAPIDPQPAPRMTVSMNFLTFDGSAVGRLPERFTTIIRFERQLRFVTLERINEAGGTGDGGLGLPSATYVGTTRAFTPSLQDYDPFAIVNVQWREGRRARLLRFLNVPIVTIPLP